YALCLRQPISTLFPYTTLFRSKLGKRLGTMTVPIFGSRAELDRYAAPGLYMGSTRLLAGNNIYTSHHLSQLSFRSHQSIMGVIEIGRAQRLNSSHRTISYAVFC